MHLQTASLFYNTARPTEIKADDHRDLPLVFDFAHPEQCAIKALTAMARAAGGPLFNCRVLVHVGRHTAAVIGRGVSVQYAPRATAQPITAEQAKAIFRDTVTHPIGTVGPRGVVTNDARRTWRHDAPVRGEFGDGRDEFNSGR